MIRSHDVEDQLPDGAGVLQLDFDALIGTRPVDQARGPFDRGPG